MKLFFYTLMIGLTLGSCAEEKLSENTKEKSGAAVNTNNSKNPQNYYPNGQVKTTGKLNKQGLKEGIWTSYFENGQKNSESNFKGGVNNGYSMVWFPNGNVRYFGDYKDGKKIGKWTFYNEKGEVVKTESF